MHEVRKLSGEARSEALQKHFAEFPPAIGSHQTCHTKHR
jgi:hypothetical protein